MHLTHLIVIFALVWWPRTRPPISLRPVLTECSTQVNSLQQSQGASDRFPGERWTYEAAPPSWLGLLSNQQKIVGPSLSWFVDDGSGTLGYPQTDLSKKKQWAKCGQQPFSQANYSKWCIFTNFQQRLDLKADYLTVIKRCQRKLWEEDCEKRREDVQRVVHYFACLLSRINLQHMHPPSRLALLIFELVCIPTVSVNSVSKASAMTHQLLLNLDSPQLTFCFLFVHKETVQASLAFSLLRCQLNEVTSEPQGDFLLVLLPRVNRALMLLGVKKANHCGQTVVRCKRPNVRLPIKQQGGKFLPLFWLK